MSQFPPAFGSQQQQQYTNPPASRTNVWAIVSLVCGIVGCFFITPIAGIITGIIGLAKSRVSGGKGMAIAGIVLSVLWIFGLIGGGIAFYKGVNTVVAKATEQPTIALINNLIDDPMGTEVGMNSALMGEEARALSEQLKPLGKCTAIDISNPSYSNVNGQVTYSFSNATATFDSGQTRKIDVTAEMNGERIVIKDLKVH